MRVVTCALPGCGLVFKTTDSRKMYCTKKHADRGRNRQPALPVPATDDILADLGKFSKLEREDKSKVLNGLAGHKIGFFDIEATHLKPNVGRILCCSFLGIDDAIPTTFHALERRFKEDDVYNDGKLGIAIRNKLEEYDIIVGWNSKNFDIKFINSRCIRVDGRIKDAQYHIDGMWSWRSKMNAWSGLESVQQFTLPSGENVKTKIAWDKWMQALGWNKRLREEAMAEIVDHCERDVLVLRDVYLLVVRNNVVRSLRKDGGIL